MKCGNYKIDLGCGTSCPKGFLGLDISKHSNANIIHDVRKGLPFCCNSADIIRAHSFLEHLTNYEFIDLMWEIWRVLKPQGKCDFLVPYGLSATQIKDPTHKMAFSEETFTYFRNGNLRQKQYCLPPFNKIEIKRQGDSIIINMRAKK